MFRFLGLLVLPAFVDAFIPRSDPRIEFRRAANPSTAKRAIEYTEHPELRPTVHHEVDQYLLDHLHPGKSAPLVWSHDGTQGYLTGGLVASLDATFNSLEVVLDHSKYISRVQCTPTSISIQFNNATAFSYAMEQWSTLPELTLVSSADGCHAKYPGQHGFFVTSGLNMTFNQQSFAVFSEGQQVSVREAVTEFKIGWEHYEPSTDLSSSTAESTSAASELKARAAALKCKADNCLNNMVHQASIASPLCQTYTTAVNTAASDIPPQISMCSQNPTSVSSACSCLMTWTSSSSSSRSTTSSVKSSTSSSHSTTSSVQTSTNSAKPVVTTPPTPTNCIADNCLRGFQHSMTLATPFCATYTAGGSQSLPAFASVCSFVPSRVSSACFCVAPPQTTSCGTRPSIVPDSLANNHLSVPCGNTFDENLDTAMGLLENASNPSAALAAYMPNVSGLSAADYTAATGNAPSRVRRSLVSRSWWSDMWDWVDDNIIEPVVHAVLDVVEEAAEAVANAIVEAAERVEELTEEAMAEVAKIAEMLLPIFHPSLSFTVPLNIAPPQSGNDDSPWGEAYKIWEYTVKSSDANSETDSAALSREKGTGELKETKDSEGEEEEPVAGVELFCVGCGITGAVTTRGTATFTLLIGFTDLQISVYGNVHAQFELGINAFVNYEYDMPEIRVAELGLPGFSIPDVLTVGPMLTLGIDATVNVDAIGQILAGARFDLNDIGATVDFFDPNECSAYGTTPQLSTLFQAYGEVTVSASVGIPVGVGIGIDIFDGLFSKEVAIIDRPAIQAVATFSIEEEDGQSLTINDGTCNGVLWYIDFINDLTLDLLGWTYDIGSWTGPKLASGCLGIIPSNNNGSSSPTTSTTSSVSSATETSSHAASTSSAGGGFQSVSTGGNSASGSHISPYGCPIADNAVTNGDFEQGIGNWTTTSASGGSSEGPEGGLASWGVSADGQTSSLPNSAYLIRSNRDFYTDFALHNSGITLCTGVYYDVNIQARLKSGGDGLVYFMSVRFGSEGMDPEEELYPVTQGKDFMSEYGSGYWDPLYIPPNPINYYTGSGCFQDNPDPSIYNYWDFYYYIADPSQNANLPPPPQGIAENPVPGDGNCDTWTPTYTDPLLTWSEDNSTVTGTLSLYFFIQYGSFDEIRVDDVMITPSSNQTPDRSHARRKRDQRKGSAQDSAVGTIAAPLPRRDTAQFSSISATVPTPAATLARRDTDSFAAVSTTSNAVAAGATVMASAIGTASYQYPALSLMLQNATAMATAASASATAASSLSHYVSVPDLSGRVQLAANLDGNLYLSLYPGVSPGTSFLSASSIVMQDDAARSFHYYPDAMSAYGVSRLRLATTGQAPVGSRLITLVPINTGVGTVYTAVDTTGQVFLFAWCTAADWIGSKVFLMNDTSGVATLQTPQVQWTVTGDVVTTCAPLVLKSQEKPLA